MHKFAQRYRNTLLELARPADRGPALRDRWDLLAPKMQSRDPLTRPQMRAVAQHQVPTGAVDLKAKNARRMLGIFQHRLVTPQPGIQRKNGLGQPEMTVRRMRPLLCGIPHRHSGSICPLRATLVRRKGARQQRQYSRFSRKARDGMPGMASKRTLSVKQLHALLWLPLALGVDLNRGRGGIGKLGDRRQHFSPMPERYADFLEVLIGQIFSPPGLINSNGNQMAGQPGRSGGSRPGSGRRRGSALKCNTHTRRRCQSLQGWIADLDRSDGLQPLGQLRLA
jgi:hypothetical protein